MAYLDSGGQDASPSFLEQLARSLGLGGSQPPPPNRQALASALAGQPAAPPPGAHYARLPGPPLLLPGADDMAPPPAAAGQPSSPPLTLPLQPVGPGPAMPMRGSVADIPNSGAIQGPATIPAPPGPAAGAAITVPGYEAKGPLTRAQVVAAPDDDKTMPAEEDWDAAANKIVQASGAPPAAAAPSAPSAYEQSLKARFDQQEQVYNRANAQAAAAKTPEVARIYAQQAASAMAEANRINDELSASRKPGTRTLSDAELTPAERAAGGEWQQTATGERSQVGKTAGDTTRAPNPEEQARLMAAGFDPKGYQVSDGKIEPIASPKAPETGEIQNYKFDQQDRQTRGLPPISFSDWNTQKKAADAGKIATSSGGIPDESLSGMDYLAQFPKDVQAAALARIDGRAMPTGGRGGPAIAALNGLAQRVGDEIGVPTDDASFSQRRKMLTDLASSSPASMGGQIKAADTALQHANSISDVLLRLHNAPGVGPAVTGHAINYAASLLASPERKADLDALNSQLTGLGQEMTKMFAGSPGAEAERLDMVSQFPRFGTPQEQKSFIDTQINRIMARVADNQHQIEQTLGPRLAPRYPALSPDVQKMLKEELPTKQAELMRRQGGPVFGAGAEAPPPIERLPGALGQPGGVAKPPAPAVNLPGTPRSPVPPPGAPKGTRQAPDGNFYAPDPARPGKYLQVNP